MYLAVHSMQLLRARCSGTQHVHPRTCCIAPSCLPFTVVCPSSEKASSGIEGISFQSRSGRFCCWRARPSTSAKFCPRDRIPFASGYLDIPRRLFRPSKRIFVPRSLLVRGLLFGKYFSLCVRDENVIILFRGALGCVCIHARFQIYISAACVKCHQREEQPPSGWGGGTFRIQVARSVF